MLLHSHIFFPVPLKLLFKSIFHKTCLLKVVPKILHALQAHPLPLGLLLESLWVSQEGSEGASGISHLELTSRKLSGKHLTGAGFRFRSCRPTWFGRGSWEFPILELNLPSRWFWLLTPVTLQQCPRVAGCPLQFHHSLPNVQVGWLHGRNTALLPSYSHPTLSSFPLDFCQLDTKYAHLGERKPS